MTKEQISSSLEKLHRELDRLAPAIEHVEAARTVTEQAKDLPRQQREFITTLTNEHRATIKEVSENLAQHLATVKANLESFQSQAEAYQQELIASSTQLYGSIAEKNETLKAIITAENEALGEVRQRVESYYDRLVAIDFPTRLDKIDATVAGIMAATQTTQSRVDNLERSITEKLEQAVARQEKLLSDRLEKLDKSQQNRVDNLERSISEQLEQAVSRQEKLLSDRFAKLDKSQKLQKTILIILLVISFLTLSLAVYRILG